MDLEVMVELAVEQHHEMLVNSLRDAGSCCLDGVLALLLLGVFI